MEHLRSGVPAMHIAAHLTRGTFLARGALLLVNPSKQPPQATRTRTLSSRVANPEPAVRLGPSYTLRGLRYQDIVLEGFQGALVLSSIDKYDDEYAVCLKASIEGTRCRDDLRL